MTPIIPPSQTAVNGPADAVTDNQSPSRFKALVQRAFGTAEAPKQTPLTLQRDSLTAPQHTNYLPAVRPDSGLALKSRISCLFPGPKESIRSAARAGKNVQDLTSSALHGAHHRGQHALGAAMKGSKNLATGSAKAATHLAHNTAHAMKGTGRAVGHLTKMLLTKAMNKKINIEHIPADRRVDPNLKLTIILHGTTEKQEPGAIKNSLTSQLVADAAQMRNSKVIVIDGISSRTSQAEIDAVHQGYENANVTYLPSNITKIAGPALQLANGNGMFKNAADVIAQVAKLDPLPGTVNICGFSRGGVTATLTTALLDEVTSHMSPSQRSQIKVNMVCLDPVPGPTKRNSPLYSRDILQHVTLDTAVTVLNAGLDPLLGILSPQKGQSGQLEEVVIMPTTHTGVNGYDESANLNKDIKVVTQYIAQTKLGITGGSYKPDDGKALESNLHIIKNQQSLALKKSFLPREEGKKLWTPVTTLWLDSSIQQAFNAKFPALADAFGIMTNPDPSERELVQPQVLLEEIGTEINSLPASADKTLLEDYAQVLQQIHAANESG